MSLRGQMLLRTRLAPVSAQLPAGIRFKGTQNQSPKFKYRGRQKSPEELKEEEEHQKYLEHINSGSRIRRWGAVAGSQAFQKSMIKWYILGYGVFMMFGANHFRKLYAKDVEKKDLLDKRGNGGVLSEWESLRLKELAGEKLRTTDVLKLQAYHQLKEKFEQSQKNLSDSEKESAVFDPSPKDIEDIMNKSPLESILPAKDLTPFYNELAPKYDKEIGMEETLSFIGGRRKWVMKHVSGDVLEVACGTGRNIKYLDPEHINSVTYLDSSEKMMEITHEKFRKKFPDFKKAGFVVGRAEDLVEITSDQGVKYDTIIETFGLCSHEDPVKALQNFGKLLKPGGRIVLLEHGRGQYDFINNTLDRRAENHSKKWGCRWNLDIGELVDMSGLEITAEKRHHFGTTWCIVAKNKGDSLKKEEIGFFEKFFTFAGSKDV